MRALILVAGAALAVSACNGNDAADDTANLDANLVTEDLGTDNVTIDANNVTIDANGMDATANAETTDLTTNDADTNLANGM